MNANEECFQAESQAVGPQMQNHQFRMLTVEDALSYLDQVKFKFGHQPQVYNDFLDIMKEFKAETLDTPGVVQRISNLFRGHPELIVGFNTFLPLGYRIEVRPNEQVSTPTPPVANSQPHTNSQSQHVCNQNSPAHIQSSGGSPGPSGTPQKRRPVEFNHAFEYVKKIKARFQEQPHVYNNFLEILRTYLKEQKNLENGVHSVDKPLTEAEVHAQVAKVFQHHDDLIQEFRVFVSLPDANGVAESAPVGLARSNTCSKLPTTEIMESKVKGLSDKGVSTCKVSIERGKEKSAVFQPCGNFVLKCGIALLICFLTGLYAGYLLSCIK